jgi:hypothetical protein
MGFFSTDKSASKGYKKAIREQQALQTPEAQDLILELERMVELGELDPTTADAILVEQTGMQDVEGDATSREAQYGALSRMSDLAEAEELDAQALAKMRSGQQAEDIRLQGQLGAIDQTARRQMGGVASSGMAQANKLLAAQQSANRGADFGFEAASEAERRALEALSNQAALGGEIEDRRFSQDAQRAQAQDAINQFNARQGHEANLAGMDAKNRAQELNVGRKYDVQTHNLGAQSEEERSRVGGIMDAYGAKRDKANAIADLQVGLGQAKAAEAAAKKKQTTGLIKTGAQAAMMFSDPDMKENATPIDVGEFLNDVTGYKYNYKDNDEDQYGVMSDDLMKSKEGSSMVDSTGKYDQVDYGKAVPGMLAALESIYTDVKSLKEKK